MTKLKKRILLSIISICIFLIVFLVVTKLGKDSDSENAVMYIENYSVNEEEYAMLVEENRNQIYLNYSTEQVNSENFWEEEIDGVQPYAVLENIVSNQLKENYAVKSLAVEMGVTEEYTYEDIVKSMKNKNSTDQVESYGLNNYDMSTYYKYWYSNLKKDVINTLINQKVHVTTEECQKYYEENKNEYMYDNEVTILYAETEGVDNKAWNQAYQLSKAMTVLDSVEEIKSEELFSDMEIQELRLNSFDTQEGMNSIYKKRWEIASEMQSGEIYGPYEDNGVYCIINCISKESKGTLEFEEVCDTIERYLQIQKANEVITERAENMEIRLIDDYAKKIIVKK